MAQRISITKLRRSQILVHRALLIVLGVGFTGLLAWQSIAITRRPASSAATNTNTTADDQRTAYTELFNLMHREVPEGNILAEGVWYTPALTASLLQYSQRSVYQEELSRMLQTSDQQHVLAFTMLLTTEVADVRNYPVGEHATVRDNAGHTYTVLGWQRMSPLTLTLTGSQKQEVGVLLVSALADDGSSIWTNDGTVISVTLSGVEAKDKLFSWQKDLAIGINYL